MLYMFCLYNFSVKCIIKKNYLPPYGPLNALKWWYRAWISTTPYHLSASYQGIQTRIERTDLDLKLRIISAELATYRYTTGGGGNTSVRLTTTSRGGGGRQHFIASHHYTTGLGDNTSVRLPSTPLGEEATLQCVSPLRQGRRRQHFSESHR